MDGRTENEDRNQKRAQTIKSNFLLEMQKRSGDHLQEKGRKKAFREGGGKRVIELKRVDFGPDDQTGSPELSQKPRKAVKNQKNDSRKKPQRGATANAVDRSVKIIGPVSSEELKGDSKRGAVEAETFTRRSRRGGNGER